MITMRNGQERSVGGNEWRPLKTSWKDAYFKIPFDKEPGKTFMYSSGNSYILSYIVQKLTGKTCRELVQERVGKEIGLTDFPWMLSRKVSARGETEFHSQQGTCSESDCFT